MSYFTESYRLTVRPKDRENTKDIKQKSDDIGTILEAAAIQIRALFPDYEAKINDADIYD